MKSRNLLSCTTFRSGELYLFHRSDRMCSSVGTLFGIVDRTHVGVVYLESSSEDMCRFRLWHRLPGSYRYFRRATRAELRDYMFNLACYECRETRNGL